MIPSWLWDRSTAHFRTALSTRFSSQSLNEENGSGTDPEVDDNEREFVCPMPDCFKAYKHSSGLRYHMKHVSTTMSTTRLLLTKCFIHAGTPSEPACAIIGSSPDSCSPISDEDKADAPKSSFRGATITQSSDAISNASVCFGCGCGCGYETFFLILRTNDQWSGFPIHVNGGWEEIKDSSLWLLNLLYLCATLQARKLTSCLKFQTHHSLPLSVINFSLTCDDNCILQNVPCQHVVPSKYLGPRNGTDRLYSHLLCHSNFTSELSTHSTY